MKENIIIAGDYNRDDLLYVANGIGIYYQIYFLEFSYNTQITSEKYKNLGKAIFWHEYKSALDLIDKVNPAKIIFYQIESYNHVSLNVACKFKGVKTYLLEHGIRKYKITEQKVKHVKGRPRLLSRFKSFKSFKVLKEKINNRLFFLNTIKQLPTAYGRFLQHYFKIRKANNIFDTFRLVNDTLRLADVYISFSPKIFEFHKINDHLPEDYPVHFIGCPSFDNLANIIIREFQGNNMIFIDQPFESQNLFGWQTDNKIEFLKQLCKFAKNTNKKLWIKPHPLNNANVYSSLKTNSNLQFINDEKVFNEAIYDSKIIIGFYSTMLMPLMAMDHTVCFSLNMHPSPHAVGISDFLVETGGINKIDTWEELQLAFTYLDAIFEEQKKHKKKFIEDWLYKFDGRASERLKEILLNAPT